MCSRVRDGQVIKKAFGCYTIAELNNINPLPGCRKANRNEFVNTTSEVTFIRTCGGVRAVFYARGNVTPPKTGSPRLSRGVLGNAREKKS